MSPPRRPNNPPKSSTSKDLVPTRGGGNDSNAKIGAVVPYLGRPRGPISAASRALVLYAKEHGGELILARNLTGPEKLRIKAETLKTAVRAPFQLEELFRIAESQFEEKLGQINRLQDHRLFYDDIVEYINSRIESCHTTKGKKPIDNFTFVAAAIGARIHNIYYLAASWKQVLLLLNDLKRLAPNIKNGNVQGLFKRKDPTFRDRYVLLYRLMVVLVGVNQKSLALAAAASVRYAHYFFTVQTAWMAFRREEAMGAMKSLIDTIVMELIFPESLYPPHILFACLHDALDGSPKEGGRFTQRMYDALGDLGEAVRFLDMIETPLSGEWAKYRDTIPPYTDTFEAYIDAEYFSIRASQDTTANQQLVNPLTKTKDKGTLNKLWKNINMISGYDVDKMWQLQDDRQSTPQWSFVFDAIYLDDGSSEFTDTDEEEKLKGALVLHKDRHKIPKNRGASGGGTGPLVKRKPNSENKKVKKITGGDKGNDSDASVPGLARISDTTSISDSVEEEESEDDDDLLYDSEAESGYDSEEMEELNRLFSQMLAEAGDEDFDEDWDNEGDDEEDEGHAGPAKYGPPRPPKPASSKPKSKNPFVRLVNQFAGRLFSLNETLTSEAPRRPDPGAVKAATHVPKPPPTAAQPKTSPQKPVAKGGAKKADRGMPPLFLPRDGDDEDDDMPPLEPIAGYNPKIPVTKGKGTTLEEVEDEDVTISKNKRKKQKKKAKAAAAQTTQPTPTPSSPPLSHVAAPASSSLGSPTASAKIKTKQGNASTTSIPSTNRTVTAYDSVYSFSSLSLHQPKAQSARSYLAEQGTLDVKTKTKKRGEPATVPEEPSEPPSKEKFGAKISKLFGKAKAKEEPAKTAKETKQEPSSRFTIPFNVGKKVKTVMQRLMTSHNQSMRWETFVKAMKAMGFTYVPSTAGSSVRFDPPDERDKPITFHKPHPDSTIHHIMLLEFRKRLQQQYGWTEEHFRQLDKAAAEEDQEEVD
ncbi:hypothetical protein FRB99_001665 [Tulasnella sp. 403]|nr:hypothetical protein FRB99_001665 [Tulasnella sp. 403]